MDAVKYIKEKERMCNSIRMTGDCGDCELSSSNNEAKWNCAMYTVKYPEEVVEKVEKWSKEHPQKTIYDDFKEKYPNALLAKNGAPLSCARHLYPEIECNYSDCKKCWDTPLEDIYE